MSMAPKSLVKLYSPGDRIELVLGKYKKLNDLLQLNGYTITSLTLNLRNALTVVLSSGITLRLGREDAISLGDLIIKCVTLAENNLKK